MLIDSNCPKMNTLEKVSVQIQVIESCSLIHDQQVIWQCRVIWETCQVVWTGKLPLTMMGYFMKVANQITIIVSLRMVRRKIENLSEINKLTKWHNRLQTATRRGKTEVLEEWQLVVAVKELLLVHARPLSQAAAIHNTPVQMPVNKKL